MHPGLPAGHPGMRSRPRGARARMASCPAADPGPSRLPAGGDGVRVVTSWTGGDAHALQRSLGMTNESFAAYLGVSVRSVAGWHRKPGTIPAQATRDILDSALERAPDRAKAQFATLLAGQAEAGQQAVAVESFEIPGAGLLAASPGGEREFGDSDYLLSVRSHIREIVA